MQAANAALEPGGLVVDGDDDLDVGRRRGRELAPGGSRGKASSACSASARLPRAGWDDPERTL